MTQIAIPAQVVSGHLRHKKALPELEGQHVIATLTAMPNDSTYGQNVENKPQNRGAAADFDPEAPPWLEVEKDLYFPMTAPSISLGKVKAKVEEGKPCIILPEELPDE